ncbi:DNA polymerase Y family protein [Sphingomonas sp. BIUV-7]|uniref:DNA polymerase Y family protein n=1 Tax=Sphingomonas natans TaxID=3063330 RepID=A0ABT8YAM7_9SPHN|nr:DNA polymerase Y family protein [Sphingomonas sp. BIUV-7]MDO6415374.1 DNA polymerase Y family protein [Sphingomonas sp. BIUV-7]
MRELGRRSEVAEHPFRAMRPDEGGRATAAPRAAGVAFAQPTVLAAQDGQKQLVFAACPAALALGLTPGMALTQARALVPDLHVRPADPDGDVALLARLALHAARIWTPTASVCGSDGLWLDLSGTTHLFGGEEPFCRRLLSFLRRIGLTSTIAIADTPGAAFALARFGTKAIEISAPGQATQAIAPLPVDALRLEDSALAACKRFGIERIADLLPMPRAPLARRLGRDAVKRLDQAIGRVAEPIVPVVDEQAPAAELRLLEPISTPEAIAQVIADLVTNLVIELRARGLGARGLEMMMLRVDGDEQCILIGTAAASREARHLVRLLHLRMEKIDPGLGIEVARLRAIRSEPLGATPLSTSLLVDAPGEEIAQLVDQLAGRVGDAAIFKTGECETDVPERAVRRVSPLTEARGWPAWRRPARLLRRPEPLSNVIALLPDSPPRRFSWRGEVHDVVAGDGPERIHGEWWVRDGEVWAVRDYFRVEDRAGGRFWLFRRGDGVEANTGDLSWWMHGAFG